MAKLPQSRVVLRFRFQKGTSGGLVKARQRFANTSRAILERVTLQYAEGMYDEVRKDVQFQLEKDLRAELWHIGSLFRRHIIGYSGRRSQPSGYIDTVTKGSGAPPRMTIASALPPWAPRNAKYLKTKRLAVGHIRWFDNTGWNSETLDLRYARRRNKVGDSYDDAGLLKESFTYDAWETLFGPISVQFRRARKLQPTDAVGGIAIKGKKMRVQIGTIYVRALGKITPAMLPGFTSGTIRASASGNPGLMGVIAETDPRLAYRLGTMRNNVYRPTLEPFLGYYLTKSLPWAVQRRIEKGNLGSITIR
jgi:hypothetical protein